MARARRFLERPLDHLAKAAAAHERLAAPAEVAVEGAEELAPVPELEPKPKRRKPQAKDERGRFA